MDPGLNSLLQWGIENSEASYNSTSNIPQTPGPNHCINAETLSALLGGPSDADLMKESMTVIRSPDANLDTKMVAFDNFEQLVEQIDNANNLESLGLWTPLVEQLSSAEPDLRRMAAWCIGTAVQNNQKSQERFLAVDGIPKLTKLAVEDVDKAVRKKAVYALSSGIRNYQPATNEAVKYLPRDIVGADSVAADDMEAIDTIMTKLRA